MVKFSWPVNLVFEKYESGLSSKDIAKKYGIHHASVQRGFKKVFGNKYTTIAQKRKPKRILSEDEIKHTFELYKRGKSVYRLAKDYKVEDEVIYRHFRKIPKYHEISQVRRLKRKVSKQDVLCAFEDYKNGATLTSLVKKYKISWNALICAFRRFSELEYKKIAKEHRLRESVNNLKLAVKINQKVNVAMIEKMISMRKLGKTVYEIAKSAAVTPITVATYLKKYNQFQAFDESRYILYKGFLGESIVKQVLETDGLNYQSQRVLTNRKKPDFLIDGKYFVEVKSQFLSYESFCEIVEKYLSAKEIKGGIIVAFYGYSKEILQTTKKYNISILNGKDIRNYFMSVDRFDLAKSVKDFLDLNYSKWKHMLPVVQKDAKYQKQKTISESKILKEF